MICNKFNKQGFLPPRLPTTCLSMPPRFDRDNANTMMCNGGSGGGMSGNMLGMNGNHMATNGPIGSVSSALRKPLLEINGLSPLYIYIPLSLISLFPPISLSPLQSSKLILLTFRQISNLSIKKDV